MNNLISYDNFLNEGIFRSDEDDIAQKLYDAISRMPNNRITGELRSGSSFFEIALRVGENEIKSNDPYSEENWGNAVEVRSDYEEGDVYRSIIPIPIYSLTINGEDLKASYRMRIKVHNLMKSKFRRSRKAVELAADEERKRALRGAIENL